MSYPLNPVLLKIKSLLTKRGWSLYRLAKAANITYSSLNSMFLKNTQPTLPTLEKICIGLEISLSDFFSDESVQDLYSEEEHQLIALYRELTPEDQALFLSYAKGFAHKSL